MYCFSKYCNSCIVILQQYLKQNFKFKKKQGLTTVTKSKETRDRSKVFTTGQDRGNSEHYVIKCMGGCYALHYSYGILTHAVCCSQSIKPMYKSFLTLDLSLNFYTIEYPVQHKYSMCVGRRHETNPSLCHGQHHRC